MSALREEERPALLDEQQSLKDAQASWAAVLAALSAGGAAISPALISIPIGVGGVVIAFLRRKQNAVERVLADPPRFDYETPTRARRRRYVPGAFGEDRFGMATDQAAIATLRAAAYLDAAVRADERAQGAERQGRAPLARWQLEQANWLMGRARAWTREMAQALNVLGMTWAAEVADAAGGPPEVEIPQTWSGELPAQAYEAFDRTQLVVADLELRVEVPQGIGGQVADLALGPARSIRALAQAAEKVGGEVDQLDAPLSRRGLPPGDVERLEHGVRARASGQLAEAQQLLLDVAERGSADAMFELAVLAQGRGDRVEEKRWLERAADANPPPRKIEYQQLLESPPAQLEAPDIPKLGRGGDEEE